MDNITYTAIIIILAVVTLVLLVKYLTVPMTYYAKMDKTQYLEVEHEIPVGDIKLHAHLVLPKYALDEYNRPLKRLPLIFLNPGWGQKIDMTFTKQFAIAFALAGPYAVLAYEYRGLGKSPGKKLMTPEILADIPKVIDYGEKLPEIDPTRMGFIGTSFGAVIALTKAYSDERLKAVVSVVGLSNCKENFSRPPKSFGEKMTLKMLHSQGVKVEILSEEDNKIMSPEFVLNADRPDLNSRVFIMNSVDDPCIAFESFDKNQKILNLPKEQTLVTQIGGHTGFHQEFVLLARVVQFFHSKLK